MKNVTDECVARVAAAAHLTDKQARAILDRIRDFRDEMAPRLEFDKMGPEIELFARREGFEEEQRAIMARRNELLSAAKFDEFRENYLGLEATEQDVRGRPIRRDTAMTRAVYRIGELHKAILKRAQAPFIQMTRANKGLKRLLSRDRDINAEFIKERHEPGASKNAEIREMAKLANEMDERFRQAINDAGGNIGELAGYGGPHRFEKFGHLFRELIFSPPPSS